MQTSFGHLVFGINVANIGFYRDFFQFIGWQVLYEDENMLGVSDSKQVSLWFGPHLKQVANDYDGPGVNHFAISTSTQAEVDQVAAYVAEHGITHLFETPRHRPDFGYTEDTTYYQVMFETPDKLLIEIVYIGPKS